MQSFAGLSAAEITSMSAHRGRIIRLIALLALLACDAAAQTYPAKPIRIIVGAGSGGGVDTISRIVGQWGRWDQVYNRTIHLTPFAQCVRHRRTPTAHWCRESTTILALDDFELPLDRRLHAHRFLV